jgi:hypothetical protein
MQSQRRNTVKLDITSPRGVYIGPYFTNHSFKNERFLEIDNNGTSEEAILNSKLSIFNVGFQLGYQFVLNNRWTIDLVFVGPSISHYRYKLNLNSTLHLIKRIFIIKLFLMLLIAFPFWRMLLVTKKLPKKDR